MILDILLVLPLLWGLVQGLIKGLISEVMAILAIILGVLGARLGGADFAVWLHRVFAWPNAACNTISYAILFIAIAIALSIAAVLLMRLFRAIHLGGLNRFLGGIFGILKWGLVVLVIVYCLHQLDTLLHFLPSNWTSTSILYPWMVSLSSQLLGALSH